MEKLVIDTETTGLSPNINKILTVGMLLVDVNKERLEILDSNHVFVKHEYYTINKEALKINKIDIHEHHKIAEYPDKACDQIDNFIEKNDLQKTPLLGHNLHFDKGFINALFRQERRIPKLHAEHEDTLYIWRKLKQQQKIPEHVSGQLSDVANFLEIDTSNAHDALADCHITAQVYHEILKKF